MELVVYDLLGREIEKLVDKYQSAGNYEVEFDGSGICSSIYFYRLKAGSYVETRKMILTK